MGTSALTAAEWIWKDGEFVAWQDAQVHLLSVAVQFGSSVFEGIRCYDTAKGPAIFRLREHIRRLHDSCRIYRMPLAHEEDALVEACRDTVRRNGLENCYVRPMVLWGYGSAGMNPVDSPLETYVAAWPWGAYLGEEALTQGVDVCVSSWMRAHPNTFPVQAKAAGHYVNAQLIKMEAVANGYVEGIALGPGGLVSEGSGQNLFLVRDGVVITPFLDGTSLAGITRTAVLAIAADLGLPRARTGRPAGEPLHRRRAVLHRHGVGGDAHPQRGPHRHRVGQGRPGDDGDPEALHGDRAG